MLMSIGSGWIHSGWIQTGSNRLRGAAIAGVAAFGFGLPRGSPAHAV